MRVDLNWNGISAFSLFDALTVAENIQLAMPPGETMASLSSRISSISKNMASVLIRVLEFTIFRLASNNVLRLSVLLQDPKLLIMDEPTSVLTKRPTAILGAATLADNGLAVLFISHKLDEIRALTSRATVLRRGQNVGSVAMKGQTNSKLAEMMIGNKVKEGRTPKAPANSKLLFEVRICIGHKIRRFL